jgi:hypothetical protein
MELQCLYLALLELITLVRKSSYVKFVLLVNSQAKELNIVQHVEPDITAQLHI